MQVDESGSSQTLLMYPPSHRSQSPGSGANRVLAGLPKRPRRMTRQTTENIEPETESDRQRHLETVHLSDDGSDEYQNPCNADQTGSESEIDGDPRDISDGTTSGRRHTSQLSRRQRNGGRMVVRISTTSTSELVSLVR